MSRDPGFGRFVVSVATLGLTIVVLGLGGMWFWFQQSANPVSGVGQLRELLPGAKAVLPANQAILYYTRDGRSLVGAVVDLGGSLSASGADKTRLLVQCLVEGRGAAFLKNPVPPGTRVLSVFVRDRVALVNLSREFAGNLRGGIDKELLAVYSIVNTVLATVETVDQVQILIDGEKLPTLHGNVDIERPLVANAALTRAG